MSEFVIIVWFIFGILGVYIGNSADKSKNIPNMPVSVLFVVFGPMVIFAILIEPVIDAMRGKSSD